MIFMAGFVLGVKGTKLNYKNFVLEAVCSGGWVGGATLHFRGFFFSCLELAIMLYSFVYKKKKEKKNPPN